MKTPEQIMLKYTQRGMDKLLPRLPKNYCELAARALLEIPKGTVLLTTGFYVNGRAETDGPPGTAALAIALSRLGHKCVVLTDSYCENCFGKLPVTIICGDKIEFTAEELLDKYEPAALISIERCGKTEHGNYQNMHGKDITRYTSAFDDLFPIAQSRGILTVGIGDGGNEIGMGNLAEAIRTELSLEPCVVKTDRVIIATVSNWGAYGLAAWLGKLCGKQLLDADMLDGFMTNLQALGSVDGVTGQHTKTVDGYQEGTENEIYGEMINCFKKTTRNKEEKTHNHKKPDPDSGFLVESRPKDLPEY